MYTIWWCTQVLYFFFFFFFVIKSFYTHEETILKPDRGRTEALAAKQKIPEMSHKPIISNILLFYFTVFISTSMMSDNELQRKDKRISELMQKAMEAKGLITRREWLETKSCFDDLSRKFDRANKSFAKSGYVPHTYIT